MRRVSGLLFIAFAVVVLAAAVSTAASEQWARGTISAMGTDTITVDVKGQAMTFKVESATEVIAPGAGTKTREAAKTGDKPKITDVLKVGDHVEVRYTEAGGVMTAALIRGGISAPAMTSDQAEKMASKKAQGIVTAVSNASLTIKAEGGTEMVFAADPKISVIGRGLGTMAREKDAQAAKMTLTDAVAVGDTVLVTYKVKDGTNHASSVSVVKKAT